VNTPLKHKELTEAEKIWLAAIIDCEGTIGVYRIKRPKTKHGYRWIAHISVSNTCKELIDRFAELTDVWLTRRRAVKTEGKQEIFLAEIRYKKIKGLLNELLPYFIAKKYQAINTISFINYLGNVGQRIEDAEVLNNHYIESRLLNRRGTVPLCIEDLKLKTA